MSKIIISIIVFVVIIGGAYFLFMSQDAVEDIDLYLEEEIIFEEEEERIDENPYEVAEIVVPTQERNEVMHQTFEEVLSEVFEKEPKLTRLTSSGDILALSYLVDRVITPDDVSQIRDLLQEEGYELEGTDTSEEAYDLNFSAEILDQEYRGNIYVLIHTAEEGEKRQKVEVRIL